MNQRSGFYPPVRADAAGAGLVSQAGGVVLADTVRACGLDAALREALAPWRKPLAVHDPAKVIADLAIAVALGGDCLADVAVLREQPGLFGPVASDPTVSRTIDALAADAPAALAAISTARAAARAVVWDRAGDRSPEHAASAAEPVVIDVDATLITAHSDKEHAAPTYKRGYGFHPLLSFIDHGAGGTGEPLAWLLRRGNAGSNTAADHISVTREALRQLPSQQAAKSATRPGRKILIRADGAGCTHEFVAWLARRRLSYSIGFTLPADFETTLKKIPVTAWAQAYDSDGKPCDGAFVADVTGLLDLASWPAGMRVIIRKERPHPGAQLRITDIDGTGSPPSPPTPDQAAPAPSCRTWNCATAGGPAARTGSASPKTPACATCRCTTSPRTRSGWPSSRWPARSPRGCKCSPSTSMKPAGGNPNDSACGCSPSPGGSPAPAAAPACTYPPPRPGRTCSSPRSPGCGPHQPPADTPSPVLSDQQHRKPGPWNRRPPRATAGQLSHPSARISPQTARRGPSQPGAEDSRKIRVKRPWGARGILLMPGVRIDICAEPGPAQLRIALLPAIADSDQLGLSGAAGVFR